MALVLQDISFGYNKQVVLEHVSNQFDNGLYAFLAPNGAGKTTLLKIIAALLEPDGGSVTYNGEDIFSLGMEYRTILGYLPQSVGYYKNYTPREYLQYLAVIKGVGKSTAEKRTEDFKEMLGIAQFIDKKMGQLSGGMLQRAGIAGALINNPAILLLDEPSAGLDPLERASLKIILSELSRDRILIISTHITSDIDFIANKVILLKDKTIYKNGGLDELLQKLDKKVYESVIKLDDKQPFFTQNKVISSRQTEAGIYVRFINELEKDAAWTVCTPDLNDLYLYEYAPSFARKVVNLQ